MKKTERTHMLSILIILINTISLSSIDQFEKRLSLEDWKWYGEHVVGMINLNGLRDNGRNNLVARFGNLIWEGRRNRPEQPMITIKELQPVNYNYQIDVKVEQHIKQSLF